MKIEFFKENPKIHRGRPIIYPFDKLEPGQKLTIECLSDIESKCQSVRTALNAFKRKNLFIWSSCVNIEGSNIVVYRLN